ncbi:MAG TPA: histidine--tRNA ligase [Candidatus Krumholzibacterium sp.]|nr:histidine--tRNA ligase [Candidatus Krumholzibacterium sp.]
MKYKRPRGTQDLFGTDMARWGLVEEKLARLAKSYGYSEIRTPVFESSDLFIRAVGEATDIVSKEMYTFKDKKGRDLTLRPENTAPVMRAFIENGLHRSAGITRFFYIGPMFRYDRPQAGRYRQFHQFGVEALGSGDPAIDAEVIEISLEVYRTFGFEGLEVRLNSVGCPECRPAFRQVLLESLEEMRGELCDNCSERAMINPMRIFDCKECGDIKLRLPVITDHLCDGCREHFDSVQRILEATGTDFVLDPLLVRGLDYYTKTAFEILHPGLGGQNALCGGGRYDGLAEDCGGPPIPAIGFSSGIERLMENVPASILENMDGSALDVYIVVEGAERAHEALGLASTLRGGGLRVSTDLSGRAMKKQMKGASSSGARFALLVGLAEAGPGETVIKDMGSGEQRTLPNEGILPFIKREEDQD